jgi:hypothetical protein
VKDPLAIGLGALGCGTGLGGGTIVAGLVIVRALERRVAAVTYEGSAADPVLAATLAGLAIAAVFGWRRSRGLDNVWQRGVIGVMSAVGAVLVGFVAWPLDRWFGFATLTGWAVAALVLGAVASAWAARGARDDALGGGE